MDVVKAIQDQGEASSDPATKCRSRSRSLASIGSHGSTLPSLYRRSSAHTASIDVMDMPYADNDQDQILDEILEEQEEVNGADKKL